MDGLRWWLLFFGVLVIAGVYFYTRRERAKPQEDRSDAPRVVPTIDGEEIESDVDDSNLPDSENQESSGDLPTDTPQKIVTLRLIARNGGAFRGDELILSMRGIGLRHGKFGIFHRYDGNDEQKTVFSAASLVEPGSFDLANIKEQEIPGISLFLVLPGPIDGIEAFDLMMEAARALAQALDAELLDESGSTLSIQRERYMR
ncbi:MAG: cell division protein ZipA C-terminal FtsZ-binding domain-containing protein, partial [Gammaproteobacteria bacterium]|nr:cell division protein ZipA C-terminal FtsZ-binding domain-containing protein [Gammaproteobacteria bacterium]